MGNSCFLFETFGYGKENLEMKKLRGGSSIVILKYEQFIGRTVQNLAQCLDIFVPDGRGLIVHHLVEILIAHA